MNDSELFSTTVLEVSASSFNQKHGGDLYSFNTDKNTLDFSSNINCIKPSYSFRRSVLKGKPFLDFGDIEYTKERENIANNFGCKKENVMVGNGVDDLIYLIVSALKPRKALIPVPNYSEYEIACKKHGCDCINYKNVAEHNFLLNLENFMGHIPSTIDIIFFSNPNNPTGRSLDEMSFEVIMNYCQTKGIYVVFDETYMPYSSDGFSASKYIDKYANLVVISSVSELYGMPGIKAGFAIGCESIIKIIADKQYPRCLDCFASRLLINAYNDKAFLKKTASYYKTEQKDFYNAISQIEGAMPVKTSANFIFIGLEGVMAGKLCERMLNKGILLRRAYNFGGVNDNYIRVAIKDQKSNQKFYDTFMRCMI